MSNSERPARAPRWGGEFQEVRADDSGGWQSAQGLGGQAQVDLFPTESEEPSQDCELEQGMVFSKTTEVCLRIHPASVLSRKGRDQTQADRDPGTDAVPAGGPESPGRARGSVANEQVKEQQE